MSANPETIVKSFYADWDVIGFTESYKKHMTPDVVVELPGVKMNSLAEWLAADEKYNETYDRPYGKVDLKKIAIAGNAVLTEREEVCYNKETGDKFTGFHALSTFEVNGDGKITRWVDYWDPAPYAPGGSASKKSV